MSDQPLSNRHCEACSRDARRVSDEDKQELKPEIPAWDLHEEDGEERLSRRFSFDDFAAALDFTGKVGALAEEQNHHPRLVTEWGAVTVSWWTHKIGGLHRNDFVMAAKTDALFVG